MENDNKKGGIFMDFIYNLIINYGYYGLFIWTAFDGTGIPNPVQIALLASGYMVSKGLMKSYAVVLIATLGNLTGNLIAYYVGFYGGRPVLAKYGRYLHIGDEDIRKVDKLFDKYGGLINMVSRWIGITRTPAIWAAGITRMDVRKYMLFSFVGDLAWAVFLTYFSYAFTENINVFTALPMGIKVLIGAVAAAVVVLAWVVFMKYYKKK